MLQIVIKYLKQLTTAFIRVAITAGVRRIYTLFVLRESRRKETRRKESTNSNIFSLFWMQRKTGRKD
jgi:hypothetical protein